MQDKEVKDHLVKEVGDVLWMCAEILTALQVQMEDCMEINIKKLQARYKGKGFSVEESINREAGDI